MKNISLLICLIALMAIASCGNKEQQRRGVDYNIIKDELALTAEQADKFDQVLDKYKKIQEDNRSANAGSTVKMDRTAMFIKMEELNNLQTAEMKQFLTEQQFGQYKEFVDKNTRKRPRYNDELLTKIKTELALTEEQSKMLEAANNAFEKQYQDAHDFYHGNGELAREYWVKYDTERKNAIENILDDAQKEKFREIVADVAPQNRK